MDVVVVVDVLENIVDVVEVIVDVLADVPSVVWSVVKVASCSVLGVVPVETEK